MAAKFCTQCGKPLEEDALFCSACGTAVKVFRQVTQPAEHPRTEQTSLAAEPAVLIQPPVAEPEAPAREEPAQEEIAQEEVAQEDAAPEVPAQQIPVQQIPAQQIPVQQIPAQQQYAPPAETAAKKKAPGKRKSGTVVGSVLLCILVFVFLTAFVLLLGLRASTTQDSGAALVKEMISNVDVREIPAANLVADKNYEGSLADWIVEKARAESNGKEQFDERDFEKYVEESKLVKELSEHLGSLVWNIREGEDGEELTTKDIRRLLESDRKAIKKHLNFNITDKDIDKVIAEVEKSKALEYTSTDFVRENAGGVYYAVQYTLSPVTFVGAILLLLLGLFLVCLVNRWKLLPIFHDLGITLVVFGAVFGAAAFVMGWMSDLIFKDLGSLAFIGGGVAGMMNSFLIPSAVILAVGIGLLIAKSVIKKTQAKKAAC